MTKRRNNIRREIASLEAKLNKPSRKARSKKSSEDDILEALGGLEDLVKQACGESFMDDMDYEDVEISEMGYMDEDMSEMDYMDDDYSEMGYMDEDMSEMDYMDDDYSEMGYMDEDMDDSEMGYMDYMDEDMDFEEDVVLAEDGPVSTHPPVQPGAEEDITQDYLDDVLEEEKSPSSIVTEPSIQDAAPGGYVANLKRASARLDRVSEYCEQQGAVKLAYRIDQISDAIDTRIEKEAR
jgi:hypothetical protein